MSGQAIVDEKISYTLNSGSSQSVVTDEYGHIYINNLEGNVDLDLTYAGCDKYYRPTLSSDLQMDDAQTQTSIQASALTVNAARTKSTKYTFTLKDSAGKVIEGNIVNIAFNGKVYTSTSDSNGIVSFALPTATAGKYAVTLAFTWDSAYKGSVAVSTIKIVKQAPKLTVAKKTSKKSATKR